MRTVCCITALLLSVALVPAWAEDAKPTTPAKETAVSLNDTKVTNQDGKEVTIGSLQGKKGLVIFQYPKADTPGCTKESCGFSEENPKYEEKGYAVVGLSHDTPADQKAFKDKYKLVLTLISDPKGELATALGLEPHKRQTAILDASGKVTQVIKTVKPVEHPADLIKELTK